MSNYQALVDILIKDEMEGRPHHETVLSLGGTPSYLVEKAGFPSLDMAVKASVLSKACFDHGIKPAVLKRLPDIIAGPKSLFRSANPVFIDSVVVLTLELQNGHPVVIPLRKDQRVGRTARYNLVSSVYGKEGIDPAVKWRQQGLLIHSW